MLGMDQIYVVRHKVLVVLALMRKRRNLDRPPAHDRGLRRDGIASSASRAR